MAKKNKTGRVVRMSDPVKILFKKILIALEEQGIGRSPDQMADELFESAVYNKAKELGL